MITTTTGHLRTSLLRTSLLRSLLLALLSAALATAAGCSDDSSTGVDAAPGDAPGATGNPLTIVDSTALGSIGGIEYMEHHCRFGGTAGNGAFGYEMNCWIIAPADISQATGLVLFDLFNTVNLDVFGEVRNGYARMGRDFILQSGFMYAGVRWDTAAIDHPRRLDLELDDDTLDPPSAPRTIGYDIIVDFARALRKSDTAQTVLGEVGHIVSYGYSQTAAVQRILALDYPAVFDGSLIHGAGARGLRMESDIIGARTEFYFDRRELPGDKGKIIQLDAEHDVVVLESADTRTGSPDAYRKYEIAGGSHNKRAVCEFVGLPDADTANPLDWHPLARSMLLIMKDWVVDGIDPPDSLLLQNVGLIIFRDANENALGGIRLPELAAGRGQYIGHDIDYPLDPATCDTSQPYRCPHEFRRVCGSFIDRLCVNYSDLNNYVTAVTTAADALVSERLLLAADRDAIVQEAMDLAGDPTTCP